MSKEPEYEMTSPLVPPAEWLKFRKAVLANSKSQIEKHRAKKNHGKHRH